MTVLKALSDFIGDQSAEWRCRGTACRQQPVGWSGYRGKKPTSGKQFRIYRPTYFVLTLKFNVITSAKARGNKAS